MSDPVFHPDHYKQHPSGIEIIELTKHMNFCLGNAVKYIMRAEYKGKQIEDLEKARNYLTIEIDRLNEMWAQEAKRLNAPALFLGDLTPEDVSEQVETHLDRVRRGFL